MVKTIKFNEYRDVGNPITTAKIYDAQRADELIFLDIDGDSKNRNVLLDIVKEVSTCCFMPFGVGGGIRTVDDIKFILLNGADKVIINTAAFEDKNFISEAANIFGSSTIVVSIDAKKNDKGEYEVFTRRATQATGMDPVSWAKEVVRRGAGEIVITSVDRDGTMEGLDMDLIESVNKAVNVPVICSGGVKDLDDFKQGYEEADISAVAAGSIFYFTDQSIIKTRRYLSNKGVNVRR